MQRIQRQRPLLWAAMAPFYAAWRKQIVFGGDWDLDCEPFSKMRVCRWVCDLAMHEADYRRSEWYRRACAALERNGVFRHKSDTVHDVAAIDRLFETQFLPLLDSMRRTGYQENRTDLPLAVISREGRVLKSEKGRHRFAAALATGVTRFPLQIAAVHLEWAGQDRRQALAKRVAELEQALVE